MKPHKASVKMLYMTVVQLYRLIWWVGGTVGTDDTKEFSVICLLTLDQSQHSCRHRHLEFYDDVRLLATENFMLRFQLFAIWCTAWLAVVCTYLSSVCARVTDMLHLSSVWVCKSWGCAIVDYYWLSVKEKAEVLQQVDQLTQIKDELTSQVSSLTSDLEKERSKVHALQNEITKLKVSLKIYCETGVSSLVHLALLYMLTAKDKAMPLLNYLELCSSSSTLNRLLLVRLVSTNAIKQRFFMTINNAIVVWRTYIHLSHCWLISNQSYLVIDNTYKHKPHKLFANP